LNFPRLLERAIARQRLAHAYLFYGRATNKYRPLVLEFFRRICCPDDSCGECKTCRQINNLTHPDLVAFPKNSEKIGVNTVREKIIKAAGLTPALADRRFFWLNDINRFTPEAANTLLKVLEEPPAGTIFVLTARSRWDCLPTIRSRCQWVRFPISLISPAESIDKIPEKIWPDESFETEKIEIWKKLIAGQANASQVNWNRSAARGFISFLMEVIRKNYSEESLDLQINENFNLTWNLIPDLIERLNELDRGTQPLLIINSIMEKLYYPEEQKEWLNVI